MSEAKQHHEAVRWLRQAQDDLKACEVLRDGGMRAQAGFYAQQAAEKAVKAVEYAADMDPWGHSITLLLQKLPDAHPLRGLRDQALLLDKLYIPTRYPDAIPDLIPAEAFTDDEIDRAHSAAERIVAAAAHALSEPPGS